MRLMLTVSEVLRDIGCETDMGAVKVENSELVVSVVGLLRADVVFIEPNAFVTVAAVEVSEIFLDVGA